MSLSLSLTDFKSWNINANKWSVFATWIHICFPLNDPSTCNPDFFTPNDLQILALPVCLCLSQAPAVQMWWWLSSHPIVLWFWARHIPCSPAKWTWTQKTAVMYCNLYVCIYIYIYIVIWLCIFSYTSFHFCQYLDPTQLMNVGWL